MTDEELPLRELADLLGLSVAEAEALVPPPIVEVQVSGDESASWFGAGEPFLLLVGVGVDGALVAEPRISWSGHEPRVEAAHLIRVGPADAVVGPSEAIRTTIARRRRRFRRCKECGTMTPPEWLHARLLCDTCAERNHGVVH